MDCGSDLHRVGLAVHILALVLSFDQGQHVSHAQQHLNEFLTDLLREGADACVFRRDAVQRLVNVTMTGLQAPTPAA